MFTIKFYNQYKTRQLIFEAEHFTILRSEAVEGSGEKRCDDIEAEVTMYFKNGDSKRFDVGVDRPRESFWPEIFHTAIIENANGKTTEIITVPFPKGI